MLTEIGNLTNKDVLLVSFCRAVQKRATAAHSKVLDACSGEELLLNVLYGNYSRKLSQNDVI